MHLRVGVTYLMAGALAAAAVLSGCSSAGTANDTGRAELTRLVVRGDTESVTNVPDCAYPLDVKGRADTAAAGLVRCYLRALVNRDLHELAPLVTTLPDAPVTLTTADLAHAADARSGRASARFVVNYSDPYDATVEVHYANGTTQRLSMDARNVMAPADHSWRLNVGRERPDPSAPRPARRGRS